MATITGCPRSKNWSVDLKQGLENEASHLLGVTLSRQSVAFESGLDVDVGDDGAAAAALKRNLGGLRLDAGSGDYDARDLDEAGDLRREKKKQDLNLNIPIAGHPYVYLRSTVGIIDSYLLR